MIQELGAASASAEAIPVPAAVGFLPPLSNYDQYRTLGEIRAHTIVVSGGADMLTPPAHSRDLAERDVLALWLPDRHTQRRPEQAG